MKPYAFGIDIGGTTVKCGFFNSDGSFVENWEIKTRKENDGALILPDIADSIREKMVAHGVTLDQVEGIGVGVPGPVLDDGVVNGCVNLGWGVFNVADKMRELIGDVRVEVGNDANVAALGEQWRGGGKGYKNVVMVTLGTGVGERSCPADTVQPARSDTFRCAKTRRLSAAAAKRAAWSSMPRRPASSAWPRSPWPMRKKTHP